MRGEDRTSGALFSYIDIDTWIAKKHPSPAMQRLTNAALADLDGAFSALYQAIGRPSIAPEQLLRATLLQLLYTIRGASGGNPPRHCVPATAPRPSRPWFRTPGWAPRGVRF
jgi:hypothetical protein